MKYEVILFSKYNGHSEFPRGIAQNSNIFLGDHVKKNLKKFLQMATNEG